MIVSDRHKFLIATPTKTGAQSLRAMAETWVRRGGDPSQLRQHWPLEHRMSIPEGSEDYARWIVVRDPYRRLVSMYNYLRRPGYYQQWEHEAAAARTFTDWLAWYAEQRDRYDTAEWPEKRITSGRIPYMWTDTYRTLHSIIAGRVPEAEARWGARPCGRLILERLAHDLQRVKVVADLRAEPEEPWGFPRLPTRNATKPQHQLRGLDDWRSYWWPATFGREAYPGHAKEQDRLTELGARLCDDDAAWLREPEEEPYNDNPPAPAGVEGSSVPQG